MSALIRVPMTQNGEAITLRVSQISHMRSERGLWSKDWSLHITMIGGERFSIFNDACDWEVRIRTAMEADAIARELQE